MVTTSRMLQLMSRSLTALACFLQVLDVLEVGDASPGGVELLATCHGRSGRGRWVGRGRRVG